MALFYSRADVGAGNTPLDKYEADGYELTENLSWETGLEVLKKKNRVILPREGIFLKKLGIEE